MFLINKKAASLMMVFTYSIVIFSISSLLVSILVSSQKFVGLSEKFNAAYYAAESGIEQAIFEINVHDVGFTASTNGSPFANPSGFSPLFYTGRLAYQWKVDGDFIGSETGFLVYNGTYFDNTQLNGDDNVEFYKDVRTLNLYRDIGDIGDVINIENACLLSGIKIAITATGSNLSKNDTRGVVYWKAFARNGSSTATGYNLGGTSYCDTADNDVTNPFCFKSDGSFTRAEKLSFGGINNEGFCKSEFGEDCTDNTQSIEDFLRNDSDPINIPYKPIVTLSYFSPLFNEANSIEFYPVKYSINTNGCLKSLPSLFTEITAVGQIYGARQEIKLRKYQGSKGVTLDYAIVQ